MTEFSKILKNGNIDIPYYTWEVPNPKATLIFIHGLKSHSGWFLDTGKRFAEKGIKVYAFDRRGSGKSAYLRGNIEDFNDWLDDIHAMVQLAQREYPELKPHLLGHCFGAKQALAYLSKYPGSAKTVSMIAPPQYALKANITLKEKLKVALTLLTGKRLDVKVPVPDEWFTQEAEKNQFIKGDSLRLQKMTTYFCREILKIDKYIHRNLKNINIPVLILLARHDDVVDNQKIKSKLLSKLQTQSKEIVEYDCWHHLFFEPRRDQVMEQIVAWMGTDQQFLNEKKLGEQKVVQNVSENFGMKSSSAQNHHSPLEGVKKRPLPLRTNK